MNARKMKSYLVKAYKKAYFTAADYHGRTRPEVDPDGKAYLDAKVETILETYYFLVGKEEALKLEALTELEYEKYDLLKGNRSKKA